MNDETIVRFDGVVKKFGTFTAVERIDLTIGRGEFLAIMGSSGCGKTTTLRMLAGLEDPTEGNIYLDGEQVSGKPSWDRDTPMVWQSLALFPFLTVQENVEFSLKMRKVGKAERAERARAWLDRLGILEFAGRNIALLSGGQRQRVALARALVTEPKILLLDEPLSALDANLKVKMQAVLSGLQKDLGITFVYVTHSMSEAFSMADRVVIMSHGRIEQIGTPEQIYRAPHNRFVAEFLGSSNIFAGRISAESDGIWSVETETGALQVEAPEGSPAEVGDACSFTVSAECMEFAPAGATSAANAVSATVVGEEFVGASATVFLETAHGQELKVRKGHDALTGLSIRPGVKLVVHWKPEHGHVLPGD